ncbi:D-glycero-beta-D-manno-heptose 1,7-bisphosphate 7-phosphatase [Methylomicrobium sp. Wu6]|uniref:D-glycero-beta-D-manno-heptose 1,7-bisphosphate 7-phosphatase n=1 Tax=Methylomicrobium sp. Wu6 TaxID=3107928 RepID=UPI002DD678FD|nr:D-glycero-beta-D-manno-heptose 1,7-bisphosphate 7-phosphatase [Methylomicrobium sp. Wu6]MEC4749674.1 D-glycero-beta-D-manno-heptose 1,7-bisphosphate 7-phosphatase [Methylomicrobium sp. Wu6]
MNRDRYVLLDRDGVINEDSDQFIKSPDEWRPIRGSLEAIALLNANGFKVIVITNQSGIARGLFDLGMLDRIHQKMQHRVAENGGAIEAIYFCPHGPESDCDCRKPKPGLLRAFAAEYQTELRDVVVIGDSQRDIQAAEAVGARPILVKTGKGEKTLKQNSDLKIPVFDNLYDAANALVAGQ